MPGFLVTGSTGQVGGELVRALASLGEVHAPTRAEMDLADPASIRRLVRALRPRWIIHPAAYTAVDRAETERDAAFAINADANRVLGEEAAALGAPIISFSTDYVFAGDKPTPYDESDLTFPASIYGASKLAGEQSLVASGAAHLIFRTSWVFSETGKNFLLTVLRVARERSEMRIVNDQLGTPTAAGDLAEMTRTIVMQCEANAGGRELSAAVQPLSGIYHASNAGETTWYGFATEILAQRRLAEPDTRFAELLPIPTAEYPTPAQRPANSRLNCARLGRTFGIRMRPWQRALADVLARLPTP